MKTQVVSEVRWSTEKRALTGEVEWGCLTQRLFNGPLDRVYVYRNREDAEDEIKHWIDKGCEAVLVTRVMPEWREVER